MQRERRFFSVGSEKTETYLIWSVIRRAPRLPTKDSPTTVAQAFPMFCGLNCNVVCDITTYNSTRRDSELKEINHGFGVLDIQHCLRNDKKKYSNRYIYQNTVMSISFDSILP